MITIKTTRTEQVQKLDKKWAVMFDDEGLEIFEDIEVEEETVYTDEEALNIKAWIERNIEELKDDAKYQARAKDMVKTFIPSKKK